MARLNQPEQTSRTLGGYLERRLAGRCAPGIDRSIDSLPVMPAQGGHAYAARAAREVAPRGYCASKKAYFHGVRLTRSRGGAAVRCHCRWTPGSGKARATI